jgi:hypothetical protein
MDPIQRFDPIESCHAFDMDEILLCEEVLFVSYLDVPRDGDGNPIKSNFPIQHPANRGDSLRMLFFLLIL